MLTPDNSTIKSFKRGDDYASSPVKPSGPSKAAGGKDFKKILGQDEKGGQEGKPKKSLKTGDIDADEGEAIAMAEEQATGSKSPASIFNLSQGKQAAEDAKTTETPSALYARLSSNRTDYPGTNLAGVNQSDLSKKGRIPSQFAQEQNDLSSVNQVAPQPAFAPISETLASNEVKTSVNQMQRIKSIEALVNQIVDKVEEIRKESAGVTETTITLKNLPLFEGAKLYVTSFDQASKEFNIRFENLLPQAKDLLDMKQYQDSLRLSLQERGYTVHILTATTYTETPIVMKEEGRFQQRDNQEGQGRQQQPKKDQEQESEEER